MLVVRCGRDREQIAGDINVGLADIAPPGRFAVATPTSFAGTLMRINGFLGDIVGLPGLMNDYSYNFALYGEPSHTQRGGGGSFSATTSP